MIKWIDTNIVMRYLLKRVNAMFVISNYLEQYYKSSVARIAIIPPLVDVEDHKWKQYVEVNNDDIEFVYSGTPGTDKDKVGLIVDCFSKMDITQGYLFNILGITRQEFLQIYPEKEEQLIKLADRIVFRGKVSHQESIAMLLRADYSIFIRDKTRKNMAGFPTKFVECYTSGIGIVANNISDIKNYFPNDNKSILLDDISEDTIKATLESIIKNKIHIITKEKRKPRNLFDYRNWRDVIENLVK